MSKVRTRKRENVNKSEKIREVLTSQGAETRTRDVISTLKDQGVAVSSAQVSNIKAALRGKANGYHVGRGQAISVTALLQAKQLASSAGGIEKAKWLLDTLTQLSK